LEACILNNNLIEELDKAQRKCARIIQGMPQRMPNPVPLATLDLTSVEASVSINKMVLLYRWLSLPSTCIYKKMAILRLVSFISYGMTERYESPLYQAFELIVKYGLHMYVLDVLQRGDKIPLKQFKNLACSAVKEMEQARFESTVLLYRSLRLFRLCFPHIGLSVWWRVSHCRPTLSQATRSVVNLVCKMYIRHDQAANISGRCSLCDDFAADDVPHLLFICSHFNGLRSPLWDDVIHSMPEPMARYVSSMRVEEKTVFILSGLNAPFTKEWMDVYSAAVTFAHRLYKAKCNTNNN